MEHNYKPIDCPNSTLLSRMKDALNTVLQSHARQSQESLVIAITQKQKQGYTFSQINDIIIKDKEDFTTQQVSRYACGKNFDGTKYTDFPENEFLAECFAEYLMSDNPRRAAQLFGQIIDDALGH